MTIPSWKLAVNHYKRIRDELGSQLIAMCLSGCFIFKATSQDVINVFKARCVIVFQIGERDWEGGERRECGRSNDEGRKLGSWEAGNQEKVSLGSLYSVTQI